MSPVLSAPARTVSLSRYYPRNLEAKMAPFVDPPTPDPESDDGIERCPVCNAVKARKIGSGPRTAAGTAQVSEVVVCPNWHRNDHPVVT